MSTQTMRAPPRRISASNKRKEREDPVKPPSPAKVPKPINRPGSDIKLRQTMPSNQLLAGYLAHEYLTRGTLFGKHWRPDRAETEPILVEPAEPKSEEYRSYVEVSGLLKADGAHFPGIVNPRQLSGFFHL